MLTKEDKGSIIGDFEVHQGDTGSPEVQIALLTRRINDLTEHLRDAPQRSLLPPRLAQDGGQPLGVAAICP